MISVLVIILVVSASVEVESKTFPFAIPRGNSLPLAINNFLGNVDNNPDIDLDEEESVVSFFTPPDESVNLKRTNEGRDSPYRPNKELLPPRIRNRLRFTRLDH